MTEDQQRLDRADEKRPAPGDITALLRQMQDGQAEAFDELLPVVYEQLRAMAHHKLRFERPDHTLNTTALVHEAYLKMTDQRWARVADRVHFFAIAAQAMRRILVSYARKHNAIKRGDGVRPMSLDSAVDLENFSGEQATELLALDQALTQLEAFNERGARVVEYRFFAGLTHQETAEVMGLSPATVRRAWDLARMWLHQALTDP
jgi:RNA polymerase sigma factor (TIGR02999 family)